MFLFAGAATMHSFPEPPRWAQHIPDMAWLAQRFAERGEKLRIAEPCVGVGSATAALHAMGFCTKAGPAWDINEKLRDPLSNLFEGRMEDIHLGPSGDLLQWTPQMVANLPPCDGLCAGPPCPPWSSTGKHGGLEDARSQVFFAVLTLIGHLARCQRFRFVLLENVPGITARLRGGPPPLM